MRYPVGTKLQYNRTKKPCTVIGHGQDSHGYKEYVLMWTTYNIKDRWSKTGIEDDFKLVSLPDVLPEELFSI